MRLVADLHVSPRTVRHLRSLGYDVIRVDDVLPRTATDRQIVDWAREAGRTILTQDLDFSALVALSGARFPSLITLRLASSRVERVNEVLESALPPLVEDLEGGCAVTIEDRLVRRRTLPIV